MALDQSSVDSPMGFQVYGECLRERLYAVQTAPVIGVYHGDIVLHGGTALATKFGALPIIEDGAVPDGTANTQKILGAVTAIFDENMLPVKRIVPTTVGDAAVAGYVLVADHPNQLFIAQEDGVTNAIDLDEMGLNADIISVALCAGDAYTGRSKQMIDSDTAAATAALDVKLHFPHPDDTADVDATPYVRWVCQINTHFYDSFNAGA